MAVFLRGGEDEYADPSSAGTLDRPEVRLGSGPNWNHATEGKEVSWCAVYAAN